MSSFPPNPPSGIATNIVISPAAANLAAGSTLQLTAALFDALGNSCSVVETVTWASSNTDLVTVSDTGLCTAMSVDDGDFSSGGQVTISVTYPFASAPGTGATISAASIITVTVTPAAPTDLFLTVDSYGPGTPTSGSWVRTTKSYQS